MIPVARVSAQRAFSASALSQAPKAIGDPTARSLFSPVHDLADAIHRDEEATPSHLPPRHARFNLVSSPDPISNIRRIRVSRPLDETEDEREWRLRREAMVDWHHNFWRDNNLDFYRAKTEFEQAAMARTNSAPSHMEMSEFYKSYLDSARERHMEYNRRWWKENFAMLSYSWRGEFRRAIRAIKRTVQSGKDVSVVIPTSPAAVAESKPKSGSA